MNSLIENGCISEIYCGSNYSLILNDSRIFSSTEYKVLQGQTDSGFIKCMRMLNNGKIQLYYVIGELKPLSSLLSAIDANSFIIIVSNLLSTIIDIKHNGFLSCQNIDISFDKIFVDQSNYKVSLVYCPLGKHVFDSYSIFENELRTGLIKVISDNRLLNSSRTGYLAQDLSSGTLSLEEIVADIKAANRKGKVGGDATEKAYTPPARVGCLHISSTSSTVNGDFRIDKDEYLIGKNPSAVDGVVAGNKMISRIHCKIVRRDDSYCIVDMQSINGTYVNGVRLAANEPTPISAGDRIRLANSDFTVSMD